VLAPKVLNWLVQSRQSSGAYLLVTLDEISFRRRIQAQRKMEQLYGHAIDAPTFQHEPLLGQAQRASLSLLLLLLDLLA
jgi:hypothetical protein